MKRKADQPLADSFRNRRQPQVSCDRCRLKKLKCDRGHPCSSCRVRGLQCSGQPPPCSSAAPPKVTSETEQTGNSILGRLAALERAVFGVTPNEDLARSLNQDGPTIITSPICSSSNSIDQQRHEAGKFLDQPCNTPQPSATRLNDSQSHASMDLNSTAPNSLGKSPKTLLPFETAIALLQDFFNNPYHMLPFLHKASVEHAMVEFYQQSAFENHDNLHSAGGALILSIAATSAHFWDQSTNSQHSFSSTDAAVQSSLAWRVAALASLNSNAMGSPSLEEAQARAILAALIANTEGQSARYRQLHMGSIAACREIGLHLLDSPGSHAADDNATKEIKRRLWWHVASTDWILALNGGPFDGIYTIHTSHMNVLKPRNLNDEDLATANDWSRPLSIPTQVSCFYHRLRLGEVCRAVVDARTAGMPDVEVTEPGRVQALDRLFEQALEEFPSFLLPNAPMPAGAPHFIPMQRTILHLGFYSRRARLHRPFLLCKSIDPGIRREEYRKSRETCLHSARIILEASTDWLEKSLTERHQHLGPVMQRFGSIINHMFLACAVLALTPQGMPEMGGETNNTKLKELHDELKYARTLLAAAGRESSVARHLVSGLTKIFRKYRVMSEADEPTSHDNPITNNFNSRRADIGISDISEALNYVSDAIRNSTEPLPVSGEDNLASQEYSKSPSLERIWDDFLNTMPATHDYWGSFLNDTSQFENLRSEVFQGE